MEYTVDLSVFKLISRRSLCLTPEAGEIFGFVECQYLNRVMTFMEYLMILEVSGFDFSDREKINKILPVLITQVWPGANCKIYNRTFRVPELHHTAKKCRMLIELFDYVKQYTAEGKKDPSEILKWYRTYITYKGDTKFKISIC